MGDELVRAVRGVTLDVDRGDYVAIVGPSGCGKSTLLNLLGGIDRPSAGTVTIDGARVDQMRDAAATRFRLLHIGFVFQRFYLMPALTARRERRAADGRSESRRARSARSARAICSPTSGSASGEVIGRRSCRAASSSAWRSRERWRTSRRSCSPTSRRASSTRTTGTEMIDLLGAGESRWDDDHRRDARRASRSRRATRRAHARRRGDRRSPSGRAMIGLPGAAESSCCGPGGRRFCCSVTASAWR